MSCIGGGNEKRGKDSCEEKIYRRIHRNEDRILLDSEDSATTNGPLGIWNECAFLLRREQKLVLMVRNILDRSQLVYV